VRGIEAMMTKLISIMLIFSFLKYLIIEKFHKN